MTLKEMAEMLGCEIKGDSNLKIEGLKDIESLANEKPQSGFIYLLESKKFLKKYPHISEANVVLTTPQFAESFDNALVSEKDQIRLKFIKLLDHYEFKIGSEHVPADGQFIHPDAEVADSATIMPGAVIMTGARIAEGALIYPNAVVEPYAEVGKGSVLYPCAVLGHHCIIGEGCILYACAVVGADGFGYHGNNPPIKVPQIGNVILGNFVEVGANSSIDRATIESTTVDDHSKFDDQVHLGHNCNVGKSVFIAGNAGISGSVTIGDRAIIAGQAGLADHITVGSEAIVMALTGVPSDLEPKKAYFGIPAREAREMHKINSALLYLPELLKRVKELESKID